MMLEKMQQAQESLLVNCFANAAELATKVLDDVKLACPVPKELVDQPLTRLTNRPHSELRDFWRGFLVNAGISAPVLQHHVLNLAQQTQLVEAFDEPASVVQSVEDKVRTVVASLPREARDIERGKNPGDVLDPYILAAAQYLMCGGDFESAIGHTVAHKALMMIEGLMGHLHEDVIGEMRGNVRVPEPRGDDQETLDPVSNPFPGADIMQPPWSATRGIAFHQVKSKTGSAKGGDGRRLGEQLLRLKNVYGGDIFYDALVGNTLRGHRSRQGVEKAAPGIVVLVGEAAFEELTGSTFGGELLLRLYQAAFMQLADESGYRVDVTARAISTAFQKVADESGAGYLESVLKRSTSNARDQLDSRLYSATTRKRGPRT